MEELRRQAGWAKTFGLPLELISAEEAKEKFPLMSTDGVLGAAWLPTDGYLDPSQLTYALADGARQGGVRIFTSTRVTGIEVTDGRVAGGRDRPRPDRMRGRRERERHVRGGDRAARRACGCPVIPMSHQYVVTQPFRERSAGERLPDPARPRPPRLLPRGRRGPRDGRLRARLRSRRSSPTAPAASTRSRADFNGRLLEDEPDRFEEIAENSKIRVPAMKDAEDHEADQRPRGVHPRQRVLPRRDRGRGLLRRRGLLRPRARRRRRHRDGDGGVDRRGRAVARPLEHGRAPLRRALPLARLHARPDPRDLRDLLRHPLPQPRARGGPPAARLAGERVAPEHGAAFGEKSGWERVNWYESNAAGATSRLRPRGWAGHALVARDRRRAPGDARERPRSSTRRRSRRWRSRGPGPAEFLEGLCDNRVARGVGQITYTQMLNSRGGIECDFTVARLAEERFSIVTGTAFGRHDRELDHLAPAPRRLGPGPRRHLGFRLLRDLGPTRPRHPAAARPRRTCRTTRFPT